MTSAAAIRHATALLLCGFAVAAGGCGFGPGESSPGTASLTVTREFGTLPMAEATLEDPTESDTVVRFLDSNAKVETSYGGNFVEAIDGYEGSTSGGGEEDWFFFVNGYYSDVGAGETRVLPGDRIWWDYRFWNAAYRVPAVVGSWPEPFVHGYDGRTYATVVQCVDAPTADCSAVTGSLEDTGADVRVEDVERPAESPDELRVLVGPWESLRDDPAARQLEDGPARSGVYARMVPCGRDWAVEPADETGRGDQPIGGAGLVAAVRQGREQPTWVVTGTDADSLTEAAGSLTEEDLSNRYAVLLPGGSSERLPATDYVIDAAPCR